jgi:hypothetical protein
MGRMRRKMTLALPKAGWGTASDRIGLSAGRGGIADAAAWSLIPVQNSEASEIWPNFNGQVLQEMLFDHM